MFEEDSIAEPDEENRDNIAEDEDESPLTIDESITEDEPNIPVEQKSPAKHTLNPMALNELK